MRRYKNVNATYIDNVLSNDLANRLQATGIAGVGKSFEELVHPLQVCSQIST
jgi:hypothetical protein